MSILPDREQPAIVQLLETRRKLAAGSDDAKRADQELVARIELELKDDLRRILLDKGKPVDGRFASQRVTELLQQFALRVLRDCPTGLMQVQSRQQLLFYVAKCLTNILNKHYRSKNRHHEHDETIQVLAELRQAEFAEEFPGGKFADLLEQLDEWERGDDQQRLWAKAVQYYYMVGMRPAQIERQLQATEKMTVRMLGDLLGTSKSSATRLLDEALAHLRLKLA